MAVANDFHKIDLEERKTVYQLMERLPKSDLIAWLVWCAAWVSKPSNQVIVTKSTGEPWEVYADWITLCYDFDLDWRLSRGNLEARVRKTGTPLFWSTTLCR